ncbi:SMC-Scp complex subunit ScpB [Clostridium sp.]|uniref:SMC-Scp complex subunit ScpB n=1 Tax=Clostridium sp. TaxID=1506 RepID=UPI00260676E9|nr:SMC-Scp complex subunit ScpB [Clostridium sp.]
MNNFKIKQVEIEEVSSNTKIKSAIEALLFVSGNPLTIKDFYNTLNVDINLIVNILNEMISEYESHEERGIKLILINNEYQLVSKADNSNYIQKLLKKNKRQSLSQASLESLAIVAYKQPITRIDIDEIRGVKSDSAIQKLIERDLIKEVGRLDVPGRPILYGTTEEFLRQFGLKELKELPSLDFYNENDEEETENIKDILNESLFIK